GGAVRSRRAARVRAPPGPPTARGALFPAPGAGPPSPAAPPPAPSPPPAAAQPPAAPPPAAVQTADPFGEPVTLEAKKVVTIKGNANWDSAFETLIDSFKVLTALLDKQGVKSNGSAMIVYTSTDDTGLAFIAEIPV